MNETKTVYQLPTSVLGRHGNTDYNILCQEQTVALPLNNVHLNYVAVKISTVVTI